MPEVVKLPKKTGRKTTMPDLSIENEIGGIVAGVDEAGRGPWAGPVVAAAVIIDKNNIPDGINDSKKLSDKKREIIFAQLQEVAQIGVGIVSVEEIDRMNILQASMLAMQKAIADLPSKPEMALIDGNKCPELPCPAKFVIKGDSISTSIAAASIIAKVTRDRIMRELAIEYPYYAWEKNAGYGTAAHQLGLADKGVTKHHRKSFKPIAKILESSC